MPPNDRSLQFTGCPIILVTSLFCNYFVRTPPPPALPPGAHHGQRVTSMTPCIIKPTKDSKYPSKQNLLNSFIVPDKSSTAHTSLLRSLSPGLLFPSRTRHALPRTLSHQFLLGFLPDGDDLQGPGLQHERVLDVPHDPVALRRDRRALQTDRDSQ